MYLYLLVNLSGKVPKLHHVHPMSHLFGTSETLDQIVVSPIIIGKNVIHNSHSRCKKVTAKWN